VYLESFKVEPNNKTILVKAHRIGFLPSKDITIDISTLNNN
jgi:hypothetical protein